MKRLIVSQYGYDIRLSGTESPVTLTPGENHVDQQDWEQARQHDRVASQVMAGMLADEGLWVATWLTRFKEAVDADVPVEDIPSTRLLELDELGVCLERTRAIRYLEAMKRTENRGGGRVLVLKALALAEGGE